MGLAIPLVGVLSDLDYFRQVGAIITSDVKRHFGPKLRKSVDMSSFSHLFDNDRQNVEAAATKVFTEMESRLHELPGAEEHWANQLSPKILRKLSDSGFLATVNEGDDIVCEGVAERELYLILEGSCEVLVGDRRVAIREAGELIGEMAFFLKEGRRTATVRALEQSRVLVLRYKTLADLNEREPKAAFEILMHLGQALSRRLAEATDLLAVNSS